MKKRHILLLLLSLGTLSCTKILELDLPKNQLTTEAVFRDSATAISALTDAYNQFGGINNSVAFSFTNIGLYTDEYAYTANTQAVHEIYLSNLSSENTTVQGFWTRLYSVIYSCNTIIDEVKRSEQLSIRLKAMLEGEAKLLRAMSYLNLVVFYERVPLILQTDVHVNMVAKQTEPQEIYDQILFDLIDAELCLKEEYPTKGKVRANNMAVKALLARVYLYLNNWENAEAKATEVIESKRYSLLSVERVFNAGSSESILELFNQNNFVPWITTIIPASNTTVPTYTITESLKNAFGENDDRRQSWVGINYVTDAQGNAVQYDYPFKYKNRSNNADQPEYLVVLRLAETILIRSEARARMGDMAGALTDLNLIRSRAGLPSLVNAGSNDDFMEIILDERRLEFFGEWGHRFQDLKRSGLLQRVMAIEKETWQNDVGDRFPIPLSEITYNPNLNQNYGY